MSTVTANARSKISPPQLAAEWGIDPAKILAWIRSGELRAINVAANVRGRPRYLIDRSDIATFEARRAATAPVNSRSQSQRPRRKQPTDLIEYF